MCACSAQSVCAYMDKKIEKPELRASFPMVQENEHQQPFVLALREDKGSYNGSHG